MENKDDLMNESLPGDGEVDLQQQDEESWVHLILGIPYFGEILTFVIAVLPAGLLFTVLPETESKTVEFFYTVGVLLITYFWLRFLERKARLAICLPIPILNIRIKWLLLPLGLLLIFADRL